VSIGCAGLGGYAGHIVELLANESARPSADLRLDVVCEPDQTRHAALISRLTKRGIRILSSVDEMLDTQVEAVWLPLPIHLHGKYTEASLAAGKAVMCEKPAAGCVADVDAMIAARDLCQLPVALGFQDMYDPTLVQMKRRLNAGELGKIRNVTVQVCWPRDVDYYKRPWAGALRHDGVWVLDSPANNAMAHFINLAMYLIGPTQQTCATPVSVEAELYRVNNIENFDTCCLRITSAAGATVLVLLTHACKDCVEPKIRLEGEHGTLLLEGNPGQMKVCRSGLPIETIVRPDSRPLMAKAFAGHVRDRTSPAPLATLEMGRVHTVIINGLAENAPIRVPNVAKVEDISALGMPQYRIAQIEAAFEVCYRTGAMLNESGAAPWSTPATKFDL
jgi:predicted dehydrogenase